MCSGQRETQPCVPWPHTLSGHPFPADLGAARAGHGNDSGTVSALALCSFKCRQDLLGV